MRIKFAAIPLIVLVSQYALAQDAGPAYAVEFNQTDNQFGTICLQTGVFTAIGDIGYTLINDIADSTNGTVYGIDGGNLVTLTPQNASITTIGSFDTAGIESLAFQPGTGVLYAVSQSGLFTVDPLTGKASLVGELGSPTGLSGNGQNIRFAPDGNLYDTNTSANNFSTGLYKISLTTGAATYLGDAEGYVNLVLANAGDQMYGVSVNVTNASSIEPVLVGFNLSQLDTELSPRNINVIPLDGETNIPANFNISGAESAAIPGFTETIPEPGVCAMVFLGFAVLALARSGPLLKARRDSSVQE